MARTITSLPHRAEWLALGQAPVCAAWTGDVLQTSGVPGFDFATGQLPQDPQRQFELAFENLEALLAQAGAKPAQVALLMVFISSREHRAHINVPWLRLFPDAAKPARKTNQAPLPSGFVVQLQATAVRAGLSRALEIPGLGHRDPLPMGSLANGLVFSSVIGGEDPATAMASDDPKAQIEQAFANVGRLMQQAGGSLDGVNHLWVFLRDFGLTPAMLDAYLSAFPIEGDRPARKSLPYPLPEGCHIQIQFDGAIGGRRRNFEAPGVGHHDPIPMASRVGRLMQSSGIHGLDPTTSRMVEGGVEAETDMIIGTVGQLMRGANGSPADIASLVILLRDLATAPIVHKRLETLFGDGELIPPTQYVNYELPADLTVQFHLTAAFED